MEKGLCSWEEFGNVVRACRDATRKAKAQSELKLSKVMKDNNKSFFKYVDSKRKTRDNVSALLNKAGVLVTGDAEKTEMSNAFFDLVFTSKNAPQDSWTLEGKD